MEIPGERTVISEGELDPGRRRLLRDPGGRGRAHPRDQRRHARPRRICASSSSSAASRSRRPIRRGRARPRRSPARCRQGGAPSSACGAPRPRRRAIQPLLPGRPARSSRFAGFRTNIAAMSRPRSWQILAVLALTNLVSYAARNALFAVVPELEARYGVDDGEIGLLQTIFMLPHAAATLGFGWAGDRFDRRRVIAAGMLLASVAGVTGALGDDYLGLAASARSSASAPPRSCRSPTRSSASSTRGRGRRAGSRSSTWASSSGGSRVSAPASASGSRRWSSRSRSRGWCWPRSSRSCRCRRPSSSARLPRAPGTSRSGRSPARSSPTRACSCGSRRCAGSWRRRSRWRSPPGATTRGSRSSSSATST